GRLDLRKMLTRVPDNTVEDPVYLQRDYAVDDALLAETLDRLIHGGEPEVTLRPAQPLGNRNKSVGGQLAIDIERMLNHEIASLPPCAVQEPQGRRVLRGGSLRVVTTGSAGQSYAAFCNDGMVMDHTGVCNDGVGKGACGGEIIIRSPAGGGRRDGHNVLIGNFALFGATGGRTFVQGQAGDRFAVRNSGATAVVEGVGDFCCEYMTNGAVMNLGDFYKGFGNGMSGGFAYQYDPQGRLPDLMSHNSVLSGTLDDGSTEAAIHEAPARQLLAWHVEATGSPRGRALLDDWENTRRHMAWVMPRALLQYQDAGAILAARSRKQLLDELAAALAAHQIAELKAAWKAGKHILAGGAPGYGETDTVEMFRLLNSYTVLEMAQALADKRGLRSVELRDKSARNLILTEDYELMSALAKHARQAVDSYTDDELAALISHKRVNDFKRALTLRTTISMDSPGTYAWILHQDEKNRRQLGEIPSFDELFASKALPDVVSRPPASLTYARPVHS
ncbi:MAG: glutamate synthase large subunit, partial [Planctomycetota bacterium]